MSAVLEEPPKEQPPTTPVLEDRVPDALKLPRVAAGFVAVLGSVFGVYSYQAVYHTDVWGHLAYGRLLWQTGSLPPTEPFMPLAQGMPLVDTAWLWQWLAYGIESRLGITGLQFLHALTITACAGALLAMFYRWTRNSVMSTAGIAAFIALNWFQFQIMRPQTAGLLCFVTLLVFLVGSPWHRRNWVLIPLVFVAWANLHGSFVVGLMLLALAATGRVIDVWQRTRRFTAPFADFRVRRLLLLAELAATAVLLNPYGLKLYSEVLTFSQNPNLNDLIEWDALQFRTLQGQIAAGAALALAVVYRLSRRQVAAGEILALVLFGGAALWSTRMLVWWTPLAAICLVRHGHAAWRRCRSAGHSVRVSPRSGKWSAVTVGLVWIFFAYTPFGLRVLHGNAGDIRKSVSPQTPLAAVDYLKEHPALGQMFNTFEWGDYLLWAGPGGTRVFLTSQVHLVPHEVWRDYMSVINVGSGWDNMLDRYSVNTVLVDKQERGALISKLKEDERWSRSYEDGVAVIYVRRKPI